MNGLDAGKGLVRRLGKRSKSIKKSSGNTKQRKADKKILKIPL